MYIEEVVGEVDALGSVGGGGSVFEDGGYGDVWKAGWLWFAIFFRFRGQGRVLRGGGGVVEFLLVEVPTPCCGKPEVVGDEAGGDDGGFFAFDDGNGCC